MKFTTSIVASLLASVAVARPRVLEDGDPLPEVSRVTAFVIDKDGNPSVECWGISKLVENSQILRTDGTSATAQALTLASSSELDGVDILTWPTFSNIWPPAPGAVTTDNFDLSKTFNLFNIQGGLINFNFYAARFGISSNDDVETHIFNLENGDDWFYFEDSTPDLDSTANTKESPFKISTISATETEAMRLRYKQQPKHKVVHKGACQFTGVKIPAPEEAHGTGTARKHSPLTVQVTLEDSL